MLFMPPGGHVVEFYKTYDPRDKSTTIRRTAKFGPFYVRLAAVCGLAYSLVTAPSAVEEGMWELDIDLKHLERTLAAALDG